jgi:hypothetical protein
MDKLRTPPVVVRRAPASFLSDVIYSVAPMTTDLGEKIRMRRRDYGVTWGE